MIYDIECPRCAGQGRVPTDVHPAMQCETCSGAGVVPHDLNEECDDD